MLTSLAVPALKISVQK